MGIESLEVASRPYFLVMYNEQTQEPSLGALPVPRQYRRWIYKDSNSPLLQYSAHQPSKHCFLLTLPKLTKMPAAGPSQSSAACAVFHDHGPMTVVSSFAEMSRSLWPWLPTVPKRKTMPFSSNTRTCISTLFPGCFNWDRGLEYSEGTLRVFYTHRGSRPKWTVFMEPWCNIDVKITRKLSKSLFTVHLRGHQIRVMP